MYMLVMLKEEKLYAVQMKIGVLDEKIFAYDLMHSMKLITHDGLNTILTWNIHLCYGLWLCETTGNRLLICNHATHETKWIEYPSVGRNWLSHFALGCTDFKFKVLRYFTNINEPPTIFDFDSNQWRRVNDPAAPTDRVHLSNAVSLLGNIYWIATEGSNKYVLVFDFKTETYRRLNFPNAWSFSTKLSSLDNKLVIWHQRFDRADKYIKEIWVSSKIDEDDQSKSLKWYKFLNTSTPFACGLSFFIEEKMKFEVSSFFTSRSDGKFVICGAEGKYLEFPFEEEYKSLFPSNSSSDAVLYPPVLTYNPSFLHIK